MLGPPSGTSCPEEKIFKGKGSSASSTQPSNRGRTSQMQSVGPVCVPKRGQVGQTTAKYLLCASVLYIILFFDLLLVFLIFLLCIFLSFPLHFKAAFIIPLY